MKNEFQNISLLISIARTVQELNFRFEKKYELSMAQWLVLFHLKDVPFCSALDLADALSVHPSSLTPALKRLKRKGYITDRVDPKDSRKKKLALTLEGRNQIQNLVPPLRRLMKGVQTQNLKKIDQALCWKESL